MIFPFGVQFHTEQRLLVWRPRGLLDEKVVTDVVAALGQLEMELHEPVNRFSDTVGVEQVELNYEYVISVAFYRRFAYADRKPIKFSDSRHPSETYSLCPNSRVVNRRLTYRCPDFSGRPLSGCAMARRAG